MTKKFQVLIILNIFLFIVYEIILHSSNIKTNYDKWKEFYEKYKKPPFFYIADVLPFTPEEMFFKISNFGKKLSFFIKNTGFSIDEFDEEDFHLDTFKKVNTEQFIISNITKYKKNDIDIMYDEYFNHSINEVNIIEDAITDENVLNIKPILEKGLNKNKIIMLFIFFIQQIQIIQLLERNFDLNKIYYLQKNKTNIEILEEYQENLFNYEDNLELSILAKQFVEYHKDFGFFNFDEFKKKKVPKITKIEKNMLDLFIKLKNMDKNEYKSLNDFELSNFLCLFERTVKSISYLGMANSLYKKAVPHYNKDIITLRLGSIFIALFINTIILTNYSDDDKSNKKKKKLK